MVPLLAALYPIRKGTSVTVREAISDFGIGAGQVSTDFFGRMLNKIRGLSRPMQLSLRNTFRRRARLVLTLITLILGGMLFMTVGSVRISLDNLIEEALQYNQFDIQIEFERPYRSAQIEQIVNSVPGIVAVETWGGGQATRIREDGSEGDHITISAPLAESGMVQPTLISGRWLLSDDENAIVISQKVLANEPDIVVGDELTLEIDGKEGKWTVVGIAQVLGGPPNVTPAYINYPYFARFTGSVGQAASVQIQTEKEGSIYIAEKVTELEETLDAAGMRVASTFTIEQLRAFTGGFFDIIVYLLLIMGVLIAAVGALGLMGTMSTNVLERTREIGVMRAIGASDGSILRIVIVEGIIIGMISWAFGAMLAFPTGLALSSVVGTVLFQTPLPYTFAANGVFTWLGIVALLAAIASFLPAWNASRL
ncbi:MAG: FtsX-like permease family protein, partial [Caldilineaceae bacterium]|nr:FtsX-like permease family protein [Caldilineaceae bacterium]